MKKPVLIVVLTISILFGLGSVLALYLASPLPTIISLRSQKKISGTIYNCHTGSPIENATVIINGRGWGFTNDGQFVWDKDYISSGKSSSEGKFIISYSIGDSVKVKKDTYLEAYDFVSDQTNMKIGLVSDLNIADKLETTYQCKLDSECQKEVTKNGVKTFYNSCTNSNVHTD